MRELESMLQQFGEFFLMARLAPRRLTEHVGVNEKRHDVSVDSDSIETKKSFSGHASSQSITPSFGAGRGEPAGTRLDHALDVKLLSAPRLRRGPASLCPVPAPIGR